MWIHLWHFISAVAGLFFGLVGKTVLGWILDTAYAASFVVVALHKKRRSDGWRAMLAHFREEYRDALKFAIWAAVVIYGGVAVWSIVTTTYQDHQRLVGDLYSEKRLVESLQHPPHLHKSFFAGNSVWGSSPGAQYVLTTNYAEKAVNIFIGCEVPIKDATVSLMSEDGYSLIHMSRHRISNTGVSLSIESPAWMPDTPLLVEVLFQHAVSTPLSQCDIAAH